MSPLGEILILVIAFTGLTLFLFNKAIRRIKIPLIIQFFNKKWKKQTLKQ